MPGDPRSPRGPSPAGRRPAGALEAEVVAVLGAAGEPLTAGQVQQRLSSRDVRLLRRLLGEGSGPADGQD